MRHALHLPRYGWIHRRRFILVTAAVVATPLALIGGWLLSSSEVSPGSAWILLIAGCALLGWLMADAAWRFLDNSDELFMPNSVLVVLDADFGERAFDLAQGCPVWAVSSPVNEAAARRAGASGQPFTLLDLNGASKEDWLIDHAGSVDRRFDGAHIRGPSILRVVGAPLSPRVQEGFQRMGFVSFDPVTEGFVARKSKG